MSELKSCPFCGNAASLESNLMQYCVICTHCSGMIGYGTAKSVIALWNKRAYDMKELADAQVVSIENYGYITAQYMALSDKHLALTEKALTLQDKLIEAHSEIERLRAFNKALGHALDLSTSK